MSADDDTNIVELLSAALRFVGYQVRTAGSGSEALAVARQWSPDLAVLDVMLPDLDGFAVTKQLRGTAWEVPVLFLTARDQMQDKLTGLTIGGDDYITKPFSLEELIARIRVVLRRTRAALAGDLTDGVLRFADLARPTAAAGDHPRTGRPEGARADRARRRGRTAPGHHQPDQQRAAPHPG
ncbi:MAG: response regulator [Pseudonocardia sp.]|nr:response regulator [Pseudonocardia sp.]